MASSPAAARPVRSFVAIEVEEPARAAIAAYVETLRRRVEHVAWTAPENLHVTLTFLGGVAAEHLVALAERLAIIAAAQSPFTVTYAGVGAFPSATRPQVLWVGAAAPQLAPLAAIVDDAAATAVGVERDHRPYHPHVTLGRVRHRERARGREAPRDDPAPRDGATPRDRAAAGATTRPRDVVAADARRAFGVAPGAALVLFRSDTGPAGARHTPLARFALGYE